MTLPISNELKWQQINKKMQFAMTSNCNLIVTGHCHPSSTTCLYIYMTIKDECYRDLTFSQASSQLTMLCIQRSVSMTRLSDRQINDIQQHWNVKRLYQNNRAIDLPRLFILILSLWETSGIQSQKGALVRYTSISSIIIPEVQNICHFWFFHISESCVFSFLYIIKSFHL